MNKNNLILYICIAIFGIVGIYLTFFVGSIRDYNSETKAYKIYPNESYDSDDTVTYQPIYYFKVNGKEYECKAKVGSSSYPSESKNTVYYDSEDPTKCKTEYEKSSGKFAGIICLIVTSVLVYFFVIKKPSNKIEDNSQMQEMDMQRQEQFAQENVEKIINVVGKAQLIYKRVTIGIAIAILLFLIIIDTAIVKQTIVSKDYPETTAVFVGKVEDGESSVFEDCKYSFTDKNGIEQEIIVSISKDEIPKQEIKLKYNEKNPQDYYEEGATMEKSGIIWYIVKIVAVVLLTILFFNKNLLNKISITTSRN